MNPKLFGSRAIGLSVGIVSLLVSCLALAQTPQKPRKTLSLPPKIEQPAPQTQAGEEYSIQLVSIRGRKTWYRGLGDDLMTLKGSACAPPVGCQPFAVGPFRMQSGKTIFPVDEKTGKAKEIIRFPAGKGNLEITFNLHITHPQHFKNVRKAMQEFAGVLGVVASGVAAGAGGGAGAGAGTGAAAGGGEAAQALAVIGKIMPQAQVSAALGNFATELVLVAGRVACGGGNPLTIDLGNKNILTRAEVSGLVNTKFKLISFHKGAQVKTCGREIVYDPIEGFLLLHKVGS